MAKKSDKTNYYNEGLVKCLNCKSTYTLGMTIESINLEICGNCHPFYTGQETLVDTAGRIEKFQARLDKQNNSQTTKKAKTRKIRSSLETIDFETPNPQADNVDSKIVENA